MTVQKTSANAVGSHAPTSKSCAASASTAASTREFECGIQLGEPRRRHFDRLDEPVVGRGARHDDDIARNEGHRQPEWQQSLPHQADDDGQHRQLVGDRIRDRTEPRVRIEAARQLAVDEIAQRRHHDGPEGAFVALLGKQPADDGDQQAAHHGDAVRHVAPRTIKGRRHGLQSCASAPHRATARAVPRRSRAHGRDSSWPEWHR